MQKLLMSAAALIFLASPAFAQHDDHHGGPGGGPPGGGGAPHAGGGAPHGGPGGQSHGAPHVRPNQAAAPQAMRPQPQSQPQSQNRPQFSHSHDRPGATPGNRPTMPDNRPGSTGRPQGNFQGNQGAGGARHDFSGFRNYHRNISAARRFQAPTYRRPAGWYDHRWTFGEVLPALFWSQDYWLTDYGSYDLPPPPYGAVWVRNNNDALLIDQDSGDIITVEYGVFY